jgi:hypothetical protein
VFAADLTQLQDKFIECGPSSVGNDLDQGEFIFHLIILLIHDQNHNRQGACIFDTKSS